MTLTPDQIAELKQAVAIASFNDQPYCMIWLKTARALLNAADELDRIKRVAATGTAENFAKLPESALHEFFAVHIEESERRKQAEIALRDAAERSQWLPIESAPKDGTVFMGYHPKYDWMGECRFSCPDDDMPEIGNPQHEFMVPVRCTHWRPKDKPPEGRGDE